MGIPKKVSERLNVELKKYQKVLKKAESKDINESDTVTIITDMFSDLFGFDKYSEITSELAIKGTYCDLAIKLDDEISLLIEVKAIGINLNENHSKQAIDYGANKGIDWVILTNGVEWRIYKIIFGKPISQDLVAEFSFLDLSHKNSSNLEMLFTLCKEGIKKTALEDFYTQRQATNKFLIGNLMLSDGCLSVLKRELKKIHPDVKVGVEEIEDVIRQDVLKREILDGEDASEAQKLIQKTARKIERAKNKE
ncbi:MAG: type I restriction enzyme HsdR N-terminal domain-containing protein [Alphaproteobacteria bacterium]